MVKKCGGLGILEMKSWESRNIEKSKTGSVLTLLQLRLSVKCIERKSTLHSSVHHQFLVTRKNAEWGCMRFHSMFNEASAVRRGDESRGDNIDIHCAILFRQQFDCIHAYQPTLKFI